MSNIAGPGCGCGCLPGTGGQYVLAATGTINNLDFGNASIVLFAGSGTTAVDIVNIYGLRAGRPGQIVSIVNATLNGVVWLQHMSPQTQGTVLENRLFNKVTSMATPLGSNGSALYQYSGFDSLWHLIVHEQGYPIQYLPEWHAADEPPSPYLGNGEINGIFVLRDTMLLTAIHIVMGSTTGYGSGAPGGWWFWTLQGPSTRFMDVGSGFAAQALSGQSVPLAVTTTPLGWMVAVVADGTSVGQGRPWTWQAGDELRLTLEINIA